MEMDSVKHDFWAGINNLDAGGRENHQALHLAIVVERLSIKWSSTGQLVFGNPAEAWENITWLYWVFLNTSVYAEWQLALITAKFR